MSKNRRNRAKNGGRNLGLGASEGVGSLAFAVSPLPGGLGDELATRSSLLRSADLAGLPNPDPILRAEGKSLAVYRTMVDDHLTSVMGKRFAAVAARTWSLERGKASARLTDRTGQMLDALPMRGLIKTGLKALGFGYSVQEIVWGVDASGFIFSERIIERPPEWFRFGLRGEVRFLDDEGTLPLVPERKLLICRHEDDSLNPYGSPILSRCFWPLAFKRGGLKLWMLFCERFGIPKTIGKVPAGTSDAEKAALLSNLEAMVRAAAAVITDNGKVELLETKISGDLPFPALVKWSDSAMSKAWLGETITTESSGTGSYGYAKAGLEVRADLALDDAAMIEEQLIGRLIQWTWEVNSLPGPTPWWRIDMPADLQMGRLARDKGLHSLGARFTPEYFEEVYNIAPNHLSKVVDSAAQTSAGAEFGARPGGSIELAAAPAASREDLLSELEQALDGTALEGQADRLVEPVLELLANSRSFGSVLEGLPELIATDALDTAAFEDLMAKLGTLAEGIGRFTDA